MGVSAGSESLSAHNLWFNNRISLPAAVLPEAGLGILAAHSHVL